MIGEGSEDVVVVGETKRISRSSITAAAAATVEGGRGGELKRSREGEVARMNRVLRTTLSGGRQRVQS